MARLATLWAVLTVTLIALADRGIASAQTPSASGAQQPAVRHRVMEALPEPLLASVQRRNRTIEAALETGDGSGAEAVIQLSLRWPQRRVVTVAFLDGDVALHRAVAAAAEEWNKHCNITLDFGLESTTGQYRRWTTNDAAHAADIRISFDRPGYWSLVGVDSRNPSIGEPDEPDGGRPSQRSMNFGGFKSSLPEGFEGTVLHEFGHALSFQHEHQHPTEGCEQEFRWSDDPGYMSTRDQFGQFIQDGQGRRPGIYTVLGGPPNKWSTSTVDHNLRQLRDSHAFQFGPFDRKSIMKYSFDAWMFRSGAASHCFSAGESVALSEGDKAAVWQAYPTDDLPPGHPDSESILPPVTETGGQLAARLERQRQRVIDLLIGTEVASDEDVKNHYKSVRGPD